MKTEKKQLNNGMITHNKFLKTNHNVKTINKNTPPGKVKRAKSDIYPIIHLGGIPMIADDMMTFIKNDIVVFGGGVFLFIIFRISFIFS